MSGNDSASRLMQAAGKDFQALEGMGNPQAFADEMLGFHAQPAVEKCLKAGLAAQGQVYPLTHDIRLLLAELKAAGAEVEPFWDLIELNAFAVQFRYESHDSSEEPLDRPSVTRRVALLLDRVKALLK